MDKKKEEEQQPWTNNYMKAVHQRTVLHETIISKLGTFPHYFHKVIISELAEKTYLIGEKKNSEE